MSVLTEEVKVLDKELIKEQYVAEETFDYSIEHSDAYYEQYIENFIPNKNKRLFYRFVKRGFDITVSLLALIVLSPIMLIIAIAIKCDSKGSVIFKQKRMGRKGKTFYCYKFRSMKTDAPRDCATACLENPEQYQTRVGRFLRKTSLDEIPQLWCVFVGSMSFIGYRPLVLTEEKCHEMRHKLNVYSVRPGISGYAQVHGRDNVHFKNKAVMDAEYVQKASLWLDLKLMFKTVVVVLKREGNQDHNKSKKSGKKKNTGV
ncbi:MAG: sugar transferase [Clostridiales bacterium]|nr:sugar transferase [Clostridiales bacterium]MBE5747641.1 sugar transferase [Clostridiales bacterium]